MKYLTFAAIGLLLIGGGCQPPQTPPADQNGNGNGTPAPTITAEPPSVIGEVKNVNVQPGQLITSPLEVQGEAIGPWFFEANLPLFILDANRQPVAQGFAIAEGEWMTVDFVPFDGTVTFTAPDSDTGYLVIARDNPSGRPEHDRSIFIPIRFR